MRKFILKGEFPDNSLFLAKVEVEDLDDAIAMAQGLRKVTTLRKVLVYQQGWAHPLWEDITQPIK